MALPMHYTYPLAPSLQTARAFAALAGAGAWDAAPTSLVVAGYDWVTVTLSYTRGAAGGAFDFQIQVSPYSIAALVPTGMGEWSIMSVYAAGVVVAGSDTQSAIQREFVRYQATAAAQEVFTFGPLELDATIERLRIRAREQGVVGTPGSLGITITLGMSP